MVKLSLKTSGNASLGLTTSGDASLDLRADAQAIGTYDYEQLINRPSIETVELVGDKTFEALGMAALSNSEIEDLLT